MAKVMSHWSMLLEGLEARPGAFYESVEEKVKRREIPDLTVNRVEYREAELGSANREYLRLSRGRHSVDICGAPFGTGFFASSWLLDRPSKTGPIAIVGFILGALVVDSMVMATMGVVMGILMFFLGNPLLFVGFVWYMNNAYDGWDDFLFEIPFIGTLYESLLRPDTFYKIDTATMFQTSVHNAVIEAIDEMTESKGIRGLSELERKPIMPMPKVMAAGSGR